MPRLIFNRFLVASDNETNLSVHSPAREPCQWNVLRGFLLFILKIREEWLVKANEKVSSASVSCA